MSTELHILLDLYLKYIPTCNRHQHKSQNIQIWSQIAEDCRREFQKEYHQTYFINQLQRLKIYLCFVKMV